MYGALVTLRFSGLLRHCRARGVGGMWGEGEGHRIWGKGKGRGGGKGRVRRIGRGNNTVGRGRDGRERGSSTWF